MAATDPTGRTWLDTEVRRLRSVTTLSITTVIDAARVVGDPGRLTPVGPNLLDNAVRHGGTSIRVGTHRTDGVVTITIDNDGDPMAPHERERVFERFVRPEQSRAATEARAAPAWRSAGRSWLCTAGGPRRPG